jgi:hypothetical protein
MSDERNITTGMSGIWRNRSCWLHLGRPTSPVVTEGTIANAAAKSRVESEIKLFGTRLRIMIYEAKPEKYESLDEIKV